MPLQELPLPLKGINYSLPEDKSQGEYSPYMLNIRPFDTLEKKIRLGKRPGMEKMYSQQIGGDSVPIVYLGLIATVD